MNINVGAISCGIFGALFLLLGAVFAALGERGVRFISGFGSLPSSPRAARRSTAARCASITCSPGSRCRSTI